MGKEDASVTSCLLAVEQIFTDLLMNREMVNETKPSKSKGEYSVTDTDIQTRFAEEVPPSLQLVTHHF